MIKTVAILGGKGMLGSDLACLASLNGITPKIFDLPEFDITTPGNLAEAVSSADAIVNCAAYTAVDKAETEIEKARAINTEAVESLGKTAKEQGKYVVHISTDFVFGDKVQAPQKEDDETFPLGVYGQTKLEGEKLLAGTDCAFSIIRVQWTYGKRGNNFISKIIDIAKKMPSLKVVDDQTGSPTHTIEAARAILCLLKKQPGGIFHFAAEGYTSRYKAAEFILNETGIKTPVEPCSSNMFHTPARRPLNSKFNCEKIDKILDFKRLPWQESLKNFLKELSPSG